MDRQKPNQVAKESSDFNKHSVRKVQDVGLEPLDKVNDIVPAVTLALLTSVSPGRSDFRDKNPE
jgi:hypothetical protein